MMNPRAALRARDSFILAVFLILPRAGGATRRSVRQHRADVGLSDGLTVHPGIAVKPPHGLAAADRAHVVFDGITGHHRLAELALIDGEEINRARLFGTIDRFDDDK